MNTFIQRQWRDIWRGGQDAMRLKLSLLRRQIEEVFKTFLMLPIYFIPLIIIRCMRPLFLVRCGEIETSGIGHLALPIEIYLCEVERGLHNPGKKFIDIWCVEKVVSNGVLLKKWSSLITIWPRWIVKPIILLNRMIPGGGPHRIPYRYVRDNSVPWQFCDIHDVLKSTRPHINFSGDEEAEGVAALRKMGIGEHDPIICFMSRDTAYYSEEQHLKWDHRNSSVHAMAGALNDLTLRGYKTIRMGAKVAERLRSTNPAIIDYATNGMRTEFLDIFIISRCRFMVSTSTGLNSLAPLFRHPVVYVNLADFGVADLWGSDAVFIPKKFWSIAEKRFLTFTEIFRLDAHHFGTTWQYKRAGIEWVDNDVDDIRAAVLEMEQRLIGNWVPRPEDEFLQNQFRSLWPTRPAGRKVLQSRIGAEFLRCNRELLQ